MLLTGTWNVSFEQHGFGNYLTEYKLILNQVNNQVTGGSPDNGSTVEGGSWILDQVTSKDVFVFSHNLGPRTFKCECRIIDSETLEGKWNLNDDTGAIKMTREDREFDPFRPIEKSQIPKSLGELKSSILESSMNNYYCKECAKGMINLKFGEQQEKALHDPGLYTELWQDLWQSAIQYREIFLGLLLLEQSNPASNDVKTATELLNNYAPGLENELIKMEGHEGITKIFTFQPEKPLGFSYSKCRITAVIRKTAAVTVGIKVGWTIKEINGVAQTNDDGIEKAIRKAKTANQSISITFLLILVSSDYSIYQNLSQLSIVSTTGIGEKPQTLVSSDSSVTKNLSQLSIVSTTDIAEKPQTLVSSNFSINGTAEDSLIWV